MSEPEIEEGFEEMFVEIRRDDLGRFFDDDGPDIVDVVREVNRVATRTPKGQVDIPSPFSTTIHSSLMEGRGMDAEFNLDAFKEAAKLKNRYEKQIRRIKDSGNATGQIEQAVKGALENIEDTKRPSLVIYGEPQSGKTEMMICLTAKLLDEGKSPVIHLVTDSIDLLTQNLKRFTKSGLAPAARNSSEVVQLQPDKAPKELVIFCKKNGKDLEKLNAWLDGQSKNSLVVIDDEADFATPNSKVNSGEITKINDSVNTLLGSEGTYIGVTATPARLDLNRTFDNDAGKWVHFPPHDAYTGQDVFFPLNGNVNYKLTLLDGVVTEKEATDAFVRFIVTVAYLNTYVNGSEENYTFLVHTSGKKVDHEEDRDVIEDCVQALLSPDSEKFNLLVKKVFDYAKSTYLGKDPALLTRYVIENASRVTLVVLNSERDRKAAGDSPTEPTSPFTVIVGGNIVSRGVTFPNLLSMFFTREVKQRIQQDTYVQRARMFGARGKYLEHFELTIPARLYSDWHRCFVFHKLALQTIKSELGSPVWISDNRVAVTGAASINKSTVILDKGEMSYDMFDFTPQVDDLIKEDQTSIETLKRLSSLIGESALPGFLIDFIEASISAEVSRNKEVSASDLLAIHVSSSVEGRGADTDKKQIERDKGLMGQSEREVRRFPKAVHHLKVFRNADNKARVFYKYMGSIQFSQNRLGA